MAGTDKIESLKKDDDKRILSIKWSSGTETKHPYTMMKDNCQCPKCFVKSARARLSSMQDLDIECMMKELSIDEKGTGIYVKWNDGHEGPFGEEWLHKHGFTKKAKEANERLHHFNEEFWGHEYEKNIVRLNYDDVMTDDHALLQFLVTMDKYGLVVINNAPQKTGILLEFGKRIAYIKQTLWGPKFQVHSKSEPSDLAYTPHKLGLHVDGPFFYYTPGLQFLHCVKNTTVGGRNEFADGFKAAAIMKEKFPDLYNILSTKIIQFQNISNDDYHQFYTLTRKRTFETDIKGKVCAINFSNQTRDSYMDMEVEEVQQMYKALKKLNDIMYSEDNIVHNQLQPGDIVCFNNRRVLHGREEYEHGPGLERLLEGAYVDWDEARSKIRMLKKYIEF